MLSSNKRRRHHYSSMHCVMCMYVCAPPSDELGCTAEVVQKLIQKKVWYDESNPWQQALSSRPIFLLHCCWLVVVTTSS